MGTSDIAATLARVEALGGRTIVPRTAIDEHIVIGMLADPEGHTNGAERAHLQRRAVEERRLAGR